jgi:hypothetical protein
MLVKCSKCQMASEVSNAWSAKCLHCGAKLMDNNSIVIAVIVVAVFIGLVFLCCGGGATTSQKECMESNAFWKCF